VGVYSERIRTKLTQAFQPQKLAVVDDSARHHGHAGADVEGGETHFNVEIVAAAFAGKSRVERQRMVHAVLADELQERVHALALKISDV
jgi:BolA protein